MKPAPLAVAVVAGLAAAGAGYFALLGLLIGDLHRKEYRNTAVGFL
jgi:hypothetical protein